MNSEIEFEVFKSDDKNICIDVGSLKIEGIINLPIFYKFMDDLDYDIELNNELKNGCNKVNMNIELTEQESNILYYEYDIKLIK